MQRRKIPGAPVLGAAVAMFAMPVDSSGGVWNVLAYEVDMASGVKLTREDFVSCIENFALYPNVPIVIEHADTNIFGRAEWARPHGWVSALRLGTFTRPDGRVVASLEGKLCPDAQTRTAINGTKDENGKEIEPPTWPFGSVTVFKGKDEETGEDVGMCLWSFSLTAHPRLVDVPRLAASKRGPDGTTTAGYYWGSVDDRDDLVEALRTIFELPALASEQDVIASLDRFEQLVNGSESADGIDTDCLLRSLREALRLPALSTATEVIAEVRKGLATLPIETPAAEAAQMSRGAAAKESPMKSFIQLAAMLGLVAASEEEAGTKLTTAAKEGIELRTALGAKDHGEATANLGKLTTEAAKVPALVIELEGFRKERTTREETERKSHVNAVVLAMALPEDQRARVSASLALHAKTDWTGFQKEYPMPSAEELAQRAQDSGRLERTPRTQKRAAPSDVGAGPGADELVEAATLLVEEHAARGEKLSFSEAIEMLTDTMPSTAPAEDDGK